MTADIDRPFAPAPAAIVRDFVNTEDHETGEDALESPASLGLYLSQEALWDGSGSVRRAHLEQALQLRAALRGALEHNHDGGEQPLEDLRLVLGALPVVLDWDAERGPTLAPAGRGVVQALARVAIAAHDCVTEGIWDRLKVCSADDCAWAYYDHSKNRSRNWCEYGCGNKIKTRAYRERRRLRSL